MARTESHGAIYAGALARDLTTRLSVSPHFARRIISAVTESLSAHLLAGRRVILRGFGVFHLKRVAAKAMRCGVLNSRVVHVQAHSVPAWLPAEPLRAAVRAATEDGGGRRAEGGNGTALPTRATDHTNTPAAEAALCNRGGATRCPPTFDTNREAVPEVGGGVARRRPPRASACPNNPVAAATPDARGGRRNSRPAHSSATSIGPMRPMRPSRSVPRAKGAR